MTLAARQGPPPSPGAHLALYDGVCGLCNRLLQFVLKYDRRGVFNFASLQSDMGKMHVARAGGNPDELTTFYVIADFRTPRPRFLTRSDAALFVVTQLGWPWKALGAAVVLPTPIRNRIYDAIARRRYRIFGKYEQCLLPGPDVRERFID